MKPHKAIEGWNQRLPIYHVGVWKHFQQHAAGYGLWRCAFHITKLANRIEIIGCDSGWNLGREYRPVRFCGHRTVINK